VVYTAEHMYSKFTVCAHGRHALNCNNYLTAISIAIFDRSYHLWTSS